MSAQHAPHDDDAGRDPHDIIPDEFYRAWPGDTVSEKLRAAESAPTSTDPETLKRCANCLSTRTVRKATEWDHAQRGPGDFICARCETHLENRLPSIVDAHRQAAHAPDTDRDAAKPRCRECLSPDLYPVPERACVEDRWICFDCKAAFDAALPSLRATARGDATAAQKEAIGAAMNGEQETDEKPLAERHADRPPMPETDGQAELSEVGE